VIKIADAERRLVAIFAADIEGYSRLMQNDKVGTLRDLTERRRILDGLIASHHGRIANTAGDSVLAEFSSRNNLNEPIAPEASTLQHRDLRGDPLSYRPIQSFRALAILTP
jgi:class 3 adenylate cyclase